MNYSSKSVVAVVIACVVCLSISGQPPQKSDPVKKEKTERTSALSRTVIGKETDIDAPTSLTTPYQVKVGDIIRITLSSTKIDPASVQSDLISGKGDGLRRIALVSDQNQFIAFYVAEKVGTAAVSFSYTTADSPSVSTSRIILFSVSSNLPGKIITVSVKGGANPVPANVGDVIRFTIDNTNLTAYWTTVVQGDAIKYASTLDEANNLRVAYYSVDRPGSATVTISYQYNNSGDSGTIFIVNVSP